MQATNLAGCRQPGADTTVTQTLTLPSPHTPLTRMGIERLQKTETVLLAHQVHTPHDHRSEEGILQVNIFKRNPLFPRRLCSPDTMYFNANTSGLQKSVITEQMLGFCKAKSLTDTVMVSSGCHLGWASLQ